jgi:hypothetical protein
MRYFFVMFGLSDAEGPNGTGQVRYKASPAPAGSAVPVRHC